MTSYEFFASPERTLEELAAIACSDSSHVAANIHRKKMTRILELTGWDDRIIREALYAFNRSRLTDSGLRCAASVLTARFNKIIKALEKGERL
ncbi:MAG: hypothetical protein MJ109_01665 [Kiritimatiellae bacterium]|nr:hypothetical protein [Kiritimatiellia bacterium]